MKNKVQILGAGLLALILTLAGCSNPLSDRPEVSSPEAVSGGKIVIQVGGLDARTLGPVDGDIDNLNYRLIIQNGSKKIEEDIEDFSQPVERSIEAGNWTVAVWAYIDDYKSVAWGEEDNVSVKDGETKHLPITLLPVTSEDAAGIFDYDIDFPDSDKDFDYESTILKLTPASSSNNSSQNPIAINLRDNNKAAAKLELPVGKYNLDITLESTRQVSGDPLKAIVKEVVYIYPHLTTLAHYEFTEAHFGADVYLKGTAKVNNHTVLGTDGKRVHNYIPKEVQIKLWDADGKVDETNIQTATITGDDEKGYTWDLPVSSEKIGGSGNATQAQLRFVVTSASAPIQTLTSAWDTHALSNQGNTGISLSADVHSIVKENDDYFDKIEGVSGIAYNSDFIGGTKVSLKIIPKAKYGVIFETISTTGSYFYDLTVKDRTLSATIFNPSSQPVTLSADFFRLKGTATISGGGAGAANYSPKTIEAYEKKWDDEKEEDIETLIGKSAITGDKSLWSWEIDPAGYVYTGDEGKIYFKVVSTSTVTGQPEQEDIIEKYIYSLIGTGTVDLNVYLFKLNNVQAKTTSTSVTITWDKADWATSGYKVYWYNGSGYIQAATLLQGTPTYTNTNLTAGTAYNYLIVGLYGSSATEGESVYVYTKLTAPQNISAVTSADTNSPFQTTVSWDSVPNADYYEVYRNGNYIDSIYSTSYNDYGYKTPEDWYSYEIAARNNNGVESARSASSNLVTFAVTNYLEPNQDVPGYIGTVGEYNYYRFTVPYNANYYFSFNEYSGLDVYGYLESVYKVKKSG